MRSIWKISIQTGDTSPWIEFLDLSEFTIIPQAEPYDLFLVVNRSTKEAKFIDGPAYQLFTTTVKDDSSALTASIIASRFIRIGQIVTYELKFQIPSAPVGTWQIQSLPGVLNSENIVWCSGFYFHVPSNTQSGIYCIAGSGLVNLSRTDGLPLDQTNAQVTLVLTYKW